MKRCAGNNEDGAASCTGTGRILLQVLWLAVLGLCVGLSAGAAAATATPELVGPRPISIPEYDGVAQLLVLSDQWVIVVTSTIDEVVAEIDRLSDGEFQRANSIWTASRGSGRPRWTERGTAMGLRDKYIAQARENAGERALERPDAYAIDSADDTRYAKPRPPERVGKTLVGVGAGRIVPGSSEVDYVHYAYLAFPEPMQTGHRYTITVQGKKSVTFLFDEDKTVSRAIKVNQVGYLPDAPRKFAYLGCHLYGLGPMDCSTYTRFEVINVDSGAVALSGDIVLRDKNGRLKSSKKGSGEGPPALITGEDVYEMDLSGLKATGDFYIRIAGVGRSWPFHHGDDTYGEVFYTAARGLYHQRCGIACEAPYTAWDRVKCHTEPVYESEQIAFAIGEFDYPKGYKVFDVVGGSIDRSRSTENVWGGWHDAADWDRRNPHYAAIFDLLYAFEIASENFVDGQLNIPESGNGIPDILDEAAFGLEVWARSMERDGGVSGYVETYTHPRIDSDLDYAFSQRTRWDSLLFAAASAQLAEHVGSFAPKVGERWAALAHRAFAFGSDRANSLGKTVIHARKDRGKGEPYTVTWEEKDKHVAPFLVHARVRMFRLTGEKQYIEGLGRELHDVPPPYEWPYTLKDYSPWIYFSMLQESDTFLPDMQRKRLAQSLLIEPADKLVSYLTDMPYRFTWPRNQSAYMGFGNSDMTNAGRALLIAYALTKDDKYRDAALLNFDYMLGANPMGMSWTTGLGFSYPIHIQHAVSNDDGIADPVPGITVYGITGGMYRALKDTVWRSPGGAASSTPVEFDVPEVPLWRRWSCHPSLNVGQCEFTIHETMSSTIFCSALLLPDGWRPSEQRRARGPRPESALYGHWYLP